MPDEPGGPTGITTPVEPVAAVTPAPATSENAVAPSGGAAVDRLANFRDGGGNLDAEKLANSYEALQSKFGEQSNEVGSLRQENSQYGDFYKSEYVADPDNPEQAVHRSVLEQRQTAPEPQPSDGQLSNEQINERLRDLQDENPIEYQNTIRALAKQDVMAEMASRDAVYAAPSAQKILGDYPDVKGRAEQISLEQNMPLQSALQLAIGETVLKMAAGDGPAAPVLPSNVNLGNITTPNRTFMSPQGTTPEPEPESSMTADQKAQADLAGIPYNELEPHVRNER